MKVEVEVGVCTRDTARCSDARSYDSKLQPCCRLHVIDIVRNIVEAFTAARIVYWADYGTLLGAVRNPLTTWADYPWLPAGEEPIAPGIIPHDKDADFGALYTDTGSRVQSASGWSRALTALRELRRMHTYDLIAYPYRGSAKVRLSSRNHTNVDVFFWLRRPDGTMYRRAYSAVDAYKGREFHESMLFPLGTVEWEGMTLPAPRDPEAFLAMRYGPNWHTPIMANHDAVKR